jgi:hypothetical protein
MSGEENITPCFALALCRGWPACHQAQLPQRPSKIGGGSKCYLPEGGREGARFAEAELEADFSNGDIRLAKRIMAGAASTPRTSAGMML